MRSLAPIAVLGALLLAAGCGTAPPAEEGRAVIVTQVPAATAPESPALGPEPGNRYPAGSRLVILHPGDPATAPRGLSEGLAAAGGASVSFDGERMVFVAKEGDGDPYAVWVAALDGSGRRRLAGPGTDVGAAAFLPDGRVVFSARVPGEPPSPALTTRWALFVVGEEDEKPQRITFGASELDPAVLSDGRVVYAQWQPGGDGRPEAGSFSLFTVHPDGTGVAPFHGEHEGPVLKLLPRQVAGGDVVFVAAAPGGTPALATADWSSPAGESLPVPLTLPAAGAPRAAEPAATGEGGALLVAAGEAGLLEAGRDGTVRRALLAADPAWRVVHAVPAAPRRRPQGHLSMIDPEGDRGELLCLDARPPGHPEAARVRLRTAAAPGRPAALLGEVALEGDGSFFATVPADVPLLLEILDRAGATLGKTETPVWVRPKEKRACVGCHEDPETAPPNRRPEAVLAAPVDLVDAHQDTEAAG